MKSNDILYIGILLVIILLICFKSISLHKNIMENFQEQNNKDDLIEDLGKVYNVDEKINNSMNNNNNEEDLVEKCKNLGAGEIGSIISKYSGKVINVEKDKDSVKGKEKYLIKWEPLGGKPGGCITANADGSYSTPICNSTIDKQLWEIIEVKDAEQFKKLIEDVGGSDRLKMGRPLDETSYPFHICKSNKHEFVLNYEGGGLSIRKLANYDSLKWDVSPDSIKQDPMPVQNNNKHTGLTPGHNTSHSDNGASIVTNNGIKGDSAGDGVNLNINVDPELLKNLLRESGGFNNEYNNEYNEEYYDENNLMGRGGNDLLISQGENSMSNRNVSEADKSNMLLDRENCENCGDIPERFIRKDLVKSMCPGCNNLDKVKT